MKRKVLFLIESLSGGGAEKILSVLLKHLNPDKFEVTLCTVVDTGVYVEEVKPYVHYISILGNPDKKKIIERLWYRLKYKLIYQILPLKWIYQLFIPKGHDVEIAFIEGFVTNLLSSSSNKKAKRIAWVHTDLINNPWITEVYSSFDEEKKSYQQYDLVVGVSQTVSNALQKKYQLKNVVTLYNPIDSNVIKHKSQEKISLPLKKDGVLRLVSVGRFVPQKAFDRLLRIVHRLVSEGYSLELWLLGDGEQRLMLENYIREYSLEKIVTLWGFCENPYPYILKSDVFVCSSVSEGYSTAVTEALILGKPVITTLCSGMNELLNNGECGLITENSEEALYLGLKRCWEKPDLLLRYKKAAMLRRKEFCVEKQIEKIEEFLSF